MSLELLNTVFSNLAQANSHNWELLLLNYEFSRQNEAYYSCRWIEIYPPERFRAFLKDIAKSYVGKADTLTDRFTEVRERDGSADAKVIYKLSGTDPLISAPLDKLLEASAHPDLEEDPLNYKMASMVSSDMELDGERKTVLFLSVISPFTQLKHRYIRYGNGKFGDIGKPLLTLRTTMDVLIIGRDVYLLTLNGEKLFNLERAYKKACKDKLWEIKKCCDFIAGFETFSKEAQKGYNPRRFLNFRASNLEALRDAGTREKLARKFNLTLTPSGDIDAEAKDTAENLIKLLCRKGMLDPFDEKPVEVDGARDWKRRGQ